MAEPQDEIEEVINPPENQPSEQEDVSPNPQAEHFRQMRDALKESREQTARHQSEIEQLKHAFAQSSNAKAPEDNPWAGLEPTELIEVAKAQEIFAKVADKAAEKKYRELRQKENSDPAYLEERAKNKHDDFDSVMTAEHIDAIIKANPLVHQGLMRSDDPIEAAYQFIKNSSHFVSKQKKTSNFMTEKAKVKDNQTKPKSPNELSQTQGMVTTSNFPRLTKEQKKELWTDHNKRLGRRV